MSVLPAAIPRSFFQILKQKTMSTGSAVSYEHSESSTPRSYSPFSTAQLNSLANESFKNVVLDGIRVSPLVLEKYAIKEKIGEGGFGVVYRAISHQSLGPVQNVALKIINRKKKGRLIEDPVLGLIPVEAFILGRISHKNIIKLIDFFQDEKAYYVITELAGSNWEQGRTNNIASRDLFEAVDAVNGLSEDKCKIVMRQLVSVIAYMQLKCSLVHRDLKDENICVDSDLNIKVIDFGSVARFPAVSEKKTNYFQMVHGTESYYAPEHIRKEVYRGPESEMWNLGCVMYTCLRNRQPFADEHEILNRDVTIGLGRYASPLYIDFLARLLNKDASQRMTIQQAMNHPWLL